MLKFSLIRKKVFITDTNAKNIGKCIKSLRERMNLTQTEFAQNFSITNKTVSAWENGTRSINTKTLQEILNYYKMSLSEFISGGKSKYEINVCSMCGNVIFTKKPTEVKCCGKTITPNDIICVENIEYTAKQLDGFLYIKVHHEMLYNHYITTVSYITDKSCSSVIFSPDDIPLAKFTDNGNGTLHITCLRHGVKTYTLNLQ